MSDYLLRDEIWQDDSSVWTDVIDRAVQEEIDLLRVGAHLFKPAISHTQSDESFPAGIVEYDDQTDVSSISNSDTAQLYEFGYRFSLTSGQVAGAKTNEDVQLLVRDGAKLIAIAEDILFFHGQDALPDLLPKQIKVQRGDENKIKKGLLKSAGKSINVNALSPERPDFFGEAIHDAVQKAIAILDEHRGPYALILDPSRYGDATTQLISTPLTSTSDKLEKLLKGGIHLTGALPPDKGLLISLGGRPITRHVFQVPGTDQNRPDVMVGFIRDGSDSTRSFFRIFQRSQLIVHNSSAIVRFDFELPQP